MRGTSAPSATAADGAGRAAEEPAGRRPIEAIGLARRALRRLTLRRLAYAGATLWFNGLFYRRTLGGQRAHGLAFAPRDSWPGDARRGGAILKDEYVFAGHAETGPDAPWRARTATGDWLAGLHAFDWLRDLRAVGGEAARRRGRDLVVDWLEHEDRWRPVSWRPDVLARRLASWLTCAEYLFPVEEGTDARPFLRSLVRQSNHLGRVAGLVDPGVERLTVLCGLVHAGVCIAGQARRLPRWLDLLAAEIDAHLASDGFHPTRSPAVQLAVLRHLVALRAVLRESGIATPRAVQDAIDRMAPMVRFFRHGDGGLALFNDTNEDEARPIDAALARAEAPGAPPVEALHTGFQRMTAGRALVLMDTGAAPPPGFDAHAHAGALSFEMSVGRQRLIVNCGAYAGARKDWRAAQRATAAHSTVTVDDLDSVESLGGAAVGAGPRPAGAARREADGNVWVDAGIADYGGVPGLGHRRRLYLASGGGDLRGEDTLTGRGAHRFSVHFHLHPSVTASLSRNAGSVLLRLGDGGGWRLRASGGATSLRESVYLGLRGEPRRTEQVVVSGALRGAEAKVKWSLTRLDA